MTWMKAILYSFISVLVFLLSTYMTVNLLLKSGGTVICPDVKGQKVEEAKRLMEDRGLSLYVVRYEPRSDIPYGFITVQKPEANITIRKGRVVNVLVSEGPQLIELPILTGQTLEDAKTTLGQKQMEVEKTIFVPSRKAGKVVAQTPAPGTRVLEGSQVVLFVGKDPYEYFLMPDTRGADMTELSEELDGKKIKYKVSYQRESSYLREDPFGLPAVPVRAGTPARTIFSRDDEILINTNGG